MPTDDGAAEREALREAVRGLLEKHSEIRDVMASPGGYDPAVWSMLCDQIGVAGLAVPERYGGAGAGLAEIGVVAHELGRTLTPSPLLGSSVLAARLVREAADEPACARLLPGLADGSRVAAVVWTGEDGTWSDRPVVTARLRGADGAASTVLHGTASYVLDGDEADTLLVPVVESDDGPPALYEVDAGAAGVSRRDAEALDPLRRLATITLSEVAGTRLGELPGDALRRARAEAVVVLAAEQTGAAERALERTVEYTLQRRQFGRPIGSFQAVKHRLADAFVRLETARSACHAAIASAARGDGPDDEDAAVAKVVCSESLQHIAAEMIQLHGGIAITWEHDAHLYFKRAHGSAALFGPPQRYLDELRYLGDPDDPAPGAPHAGSRDTANAASGVSGG
ncbi:MULTISPECIES: acyl-CoA dehydrogenase family protein [Prauserella salsuginis group]|uniref:Acyl-CoA dehydrogenase family protein n=1 Tax=Prauserella salsuginis TaxID=387889 RepID=A0ABW6G5A8_9PSEU|nr:MULTISPECIES: acyl-CoA dehydrogenase family protein [Prauserella salsuginis group]MCR3718926.1 hypothetical protein [Prauserella flava]MCR3733496.1 hypothetical protein [Prauserella salsuginis]